MQGQNGGQDGNGVDLAVIAGDDQEGGAEAHQPGGDQP